MASRIAAGKFPTADAVAFQQTDIGPIPADWRLEQMCDLGQALAGLTYSPSDVRPDGVLVLRSSNVQGGRLAYDDNVFVQMDIPSRAIVREGDILICVRNGSRELIGKCARIDRNAAGMAFGAFMGVFRSPINDFVFFAFQADTLQRQIREHLGATINQITNKSLNSFLIAVPPTATETHKIAGALSDADAMIEALESLIAKKRAIKQGAMQELLSGRRRLPGFEAGWEPVNLPEIAEILSGGTPSTARSDYWDGEVLWCTPTDITALGNRKYLRDTSRKITQHGLKDSSAEWIPAGSVIMTSRATIGECAINVLPVTTNQGFKNLVPRAQTDVEFLYYLMITQKERLIALCGGSTFLEIGKTQLTSFDVTIPTTKAEQVAISTVLADMDSELEVAQTRLVKARRIKKGMMQELLTGRVRLL